MRGILSPAPAPSAARLLVGSQLLLLVQACLVLCSRPPRDATMLVMIAAVTITAVVALIAALIGEDTQSPHRENGRHAR